MSEVVLVEAGNAFTHVAVRGRLDAAGVGAVDIKLTGQTVARRKPAVIDLTEVGFIGSLGVGMLVRIAKSMLTCGARVVVMAAPPVSGVLEMARLSPVIEVVATREDALRTLAVA